DFLLAFELTLPRRLHIYIYGSFVHRVLHSFPTRRSSDLLVRSRPGGGRARAADGGQGSGHRGVRPGRAHAADRGGDRGADQGNQDRKSTRLNSSHVKISYAVFCLKKKK